MRNVNRPLDFQQIAPRELSLLTQIKVFFGGAIFQIGAGIFWFGLPFSLVFVLESEVVHLFQFDGAWIKTEGVLQELEETNSSVNDEPIYRYHFSYNVDGQSYQGYSSAVYKPEYNTVNAEKVVPVEYKEQNIGRARIVGMRQQTFSAWIALILLFPLVGAILYLWGIKANYKALRLLKIGKVAYGRLLRATATNTSINEETVYQYEFGFEVEGRSYIAKAETHLTTVLEDEEEELILYNENNPEESLVYDSISSINKLDIEGNVPKAGILALTSTLSTVVGIVITVIVILVYV
ncbi:MAG: DUF3592 domain-containing protein [Aureispira sp.]